MADFDLIKEKLVKGKGPEVAGLVKEALEQKAEPKEILDKALIAGMDMITEKWRSNQIFMPEVMLAARSMKLAMTHLEPVLAKSDMQTLGNVIIGTIKGDLHDIGKNLVTIMLKGAGFNVTDIGIDQNPENFVKAAQENQSSLVGLSALITTTMPVMKEVIEAFESAKLREKVKIAVGGAPVTQEFADKIGADGYADDAAGAVGLFKGFIQT
jgi:5-methyltetrahydrofolate--homocysteine methyltransferase